jgi:hypothetical protein
MSRDALHARYDSTVDGGDVESGKRFIDTVPLRTKDEAKRNEDPSGIKDTWSRAEVWEIWDKETKQVIHMVEGFNRVLDVVEDPLELPNFFPSPKPLMSNVTTKNLIPKAGYLLAEDLYKEAHDLTRRIALLVKAIKVAGVYDRQNEGIQKLLDEAVENVLLPIDNWLSFMEKGGIGGAVNFMPLENIVAAVGQLVMQHRQA